MGKVTFEHRTSCRYSSFILFGDILLKKLSALILTSLADPAVSIGSELALSFRRIDVRHVLA